MKHADEIVLGFDGSAEAQQAIQLVSRLSSAGGHVTIVRVAEQTPLPAQALVSSRTMATVREEVKRINAEKLALAQRETARAADLLKEAGWHVRTIVTTGVPLRSLLTTVEKMRAGLLVVGARGASGLRHVLLGSVTEGALNQCPVSILIAR